MTPELELEKEIAVLREELERERKAAAGSEHALKEAKGFVSDLESELQRVQRERDALQAQVAQLREALEDLIGQACEFIGPDEDGTPECVCCHMELGEDLKGHRSDCLANAIMGHSRALSAPAPRVITAEDAEKAHDQEIGEFQDEVRCLIIERTGAPDSAIDGKGSDAGWQEFTLAEIEQGIAYLKEKHGEDVKPLVEAIETCEMSAANLGYIGLPADAVKKAIAHAKAKGWLT